MKRATYRNSGVDINKGDEFVDRIAPLIKKIDTRGVLGGIGGFSGLFEIEKKKYKEPVLAASTDGVGTKLLLTLGLDRYDTIGIDLVAMCANDIVVTGARPIFFLDYFATGKLQLPKAVEIMRGIVEGCRQAGCALLGGETAELPGLYHKGHYDLAGFCVGIVDKSDIIDSSSVRPNDVILGVQSSGLHSNGYSLVRKLFSSKQLRGMTGELAIVPTIIYVKPVLKLLETLKIKAMAHITGGGFYGNIPRVIPPDMNACIDAKTWRAPAIYTLIKNRSRLSPKKMFTTFNMGIGLVIVLAEKDLARAQGILNSFKLGSYRIGTITKGNGRVVIGS